MEEKLMEGLAYALPAAVTGFVAYYFFSGFLRHDTKEKKFQSLVEKKRESLPIKLQAYERLVLLCDRINPTKLLQRVSNKNEDINAYLQLLIATIEQELEYNNVQQIYVSDTSWTAVIACKKAICNRLELIASNSKSIQEFKDKTLLDYKTQSNHSEVAIGIIKQEIKKLL